MDNDVIVLLQNFSFYNILEHHFQLLKEIMQLQINDGINLCWVSHKRTGTFAVSFGGGPGQHTRRSEENEINWYYSISLNVLPSGL